MTLKEFEMHRPRLHASLMRHLGTDFEVVDVEPVYEGETLFKAKLKNAQHGWEVDDVVCVSPDHPMAFHEEEAPGEPTWWWQADVES